MTSTLDVRLAHILRSSDAAPTIFSTITKLCTLSFRGCTLFGTAFTGEAEVRKRTLWFGFCLDTITFRRSSLGAVSQPWGLRR